MKNLTETILLLIIGMAVGAIVTNGLYFTVGLSMLLGLAEATFGAWKDTLFEEFDLKKFFRSPIIVTGHAIWLSVIFAEVPMILVVGSALSMERLTVEAYKAIIRKPPGKFKCPEKDRGWLRKRLIQYVSTSEKF